MPQATALKEPKNILNNLDIKIRFIEAVLRSVKLKSGCVSVCVCVCVCVCVSVCNWSIWIRHVSNLPWASFVMLENSSS